MKTEIINVQGKKVEFYIDSEGYPVAPVENSSALLWVLLIAILFVLFS